MRTRRFKPQTVLESDGVEEVTGGAGPGAPCVNDWMPHHLMPHHSPLLFCFGGSETERKRRAEDEQLLHNAWRSRPDEGKCAAVESPGLPSPGLPRPALSRIESPTLPNPAFTSQPRARGGEGSVRGQRADMGGLSEVVDVDSALLPRLPVLLAQSVLNLYSSLS